MTQSEFNQRHKDSPILSKIEDLKGGDIMRVLNASYISERFLENQKAGFPKSSTIMLKTALLPILHPLR